MSIFCLAVLTRFPLYLFFTPLDSAQGDKKKLARKTGGDAAAIVNPPLNRLKNLYQSIISFQKPTSSGTSASSVVKNLTNAISKQQQSPQSRNYQTGKRYWRQHFPAKRHQLVDP
jgi:hypothetical protein